MAQFTPLVSTAEFTPVSYDDYMKPHALAEAAYQNRRQMLDQGADALAAYLPYLNDATPEARKLYDDAQAQINRNVKLLGTKGWNLNPEPLIAFKEQYRNTNSILKKAATSLEELQKADKEAMTKDGSLFVRYKNKAGDFIQPNIDSMITSNYERHTVSGSDLQANAMAAAQALSARTKAAFSTFYKSGQTTGFYTTKTGYMSGVSNAVLMDWLVNPDNHTEEINSWLQNVKKFGGQHAMDTMKDLFKNNEFKNALENIVNRTDYDNMEQSDKVRLNKYLMTGVYQGLKYDESLQRHDTPYDNTPKDAGGHGGGGDGAVTPEVTPPKTAPWIYTPEDKAKADIYQKLKRYLGFDDSMFGKTGIITLPNQMAMVDRHRFYGKDDDYSKADEFINTIIGAKDDNGNPIGNDILDYFSLFDEQGNILDTEAFKRTYEKRMEEIASRDYYTKNEGNQDYGKNFKELIQTVPAYSLEEQNIHIEGNEPIRSNVPSLSPRISSDNIYKEIKSAVLDLYEIPESEKKEIMEDKTGGKYDDFIKKNKITKASLTNKVIDMADRYANTNVDQQYATFSNNNEDIIKDVLKNNQVTNGDNKGKYTLNVIESSDQLTFKTETYTDEKGNKVKYKNYKIKPGYEKHLDDSELFFAPGDDKTKSYNCFYYIPADPSQGLVVQFPSGIRTLIPPEKLGSLYNADMIATWTAGSKEARATMEACINRIKEINLEIEKINNDKNMSEADKSAKLVELQNEIQGCGQAYQNAQSAIVNYRSNITKSFINNISTSYKANNV